MRLPLLALIECSSNVANGSKILCDDNEVKSSLIGALVKKIWQCLEIGLLGVQSLKTITTVRMWLKPNSCGKLSQRF